MGDIATLDITTLRDDFPILSAENHEQPLVYLDSGATTQKPESVIKAVDRYYRHDNANVHRGVYALSQRATTAYEGTRQTIKQFINARHNHEIIFTRGTTEAINLVAYSFGLLKIKAGDEILISHMEHHSNIVPWQMLCERTGAVLKVIPVLDDGSLDFNAYQQLLSAKTKLVAIIHVSNVLGTINPIKNIIEAAHASDVPALIDGAQAVSRLKVDVQELDCDFYTFSAHKAYGPTGVGVLYGKEKWLERMPPYQGGGDMISQVSFTKTEYNVLPHKFEAGTPNMAGVVGLGEALHYIQEIGVEHIFEHEKMLTTIASDALQQIPGLRIIGNAKEKIGVISFVMDQVHPHDIGTILDTENIAVRAGHHCAMPLMQRFKVPATVRVSFGVYNQQQDIERLLVGMNKVLEMFG
jgi:cysteine desulfurase / selenocysteine lyase